MKEKIINYLLTHADPSIVLRIKREILQNLSEKEETELLDQIILQKNVQSVLQAQKADGWIGNYFHGMSGKYGAGMYDNMEVGLRYLAEKGFLPKSDYLYKAVHSFLLESEENKIARPHPKAPVNDYELTACGLYLMRSSVIIRAGYEQLFPQNDFIDLTFDINYSFKTFANVLNFSSVDEVIDTHRKKACFKPDTPWPCVYDLRILAHSKAWKSTESITLLAKSVSRLFTFPQSGVDIYTYNKGQYISPCHAFIHIPILGGSISDEFIGSHWFDMMELFARCGVVKKVEALKKEYLSLLERLDEDIDLTTIFSKHKSENSWSPYDGIALEENWRSKIKKQCDLLFRALLIIYYTELGTSAD